MKFRTSNFSSNKRRTSKLQSPKLPVTLIRGSMVIVQRNFNSLLETDSSSTPTQQQKAVLKNVASEGSGGSKQMSVC